MDMTSVLHEAESMDGYVKWDGCCEIELGQPHWCGASDVADFCKVLTELHKLCLILPSVDKDCAGYEETDTHDSP